MESSRRSKCKLYVHCSRFHLAFSTVLTQKCVLQLLDCGLSDEQAEALASTGRTAHSTHKLTSEDVRVLMQVGLTEQQKKKLMSAGMKAGMALGMKLFNKHVSKQSALLWLNGFLDNCATACRD